MLTSESFRLQQQAFPPLYHKFASSTVKKQEDGGENVYYNMAYACNDDRTIPQLDKSSRPMRTGCT